MPLSLPAISDLLPKLGPCRLMPRPQHKDADEELQEIFKEAIVEPIQASKGAHPDEEVQLGFEDEARFGPHGTVAQVMARSAASRPA